MIFANPVIRPVVNGELGYPQTRALDIAWVGLASDAKENVGRGHFEIARDSARRARALVAAFGNRRPLERGPRS